MRLLADESIERTVIDRLRADGHDVVAVSDVCPGVDDETVLERATKERRVLLTNDKDFATLAFLQRKASAGIVLVRMPKARAATKATRVSGVLADLKEALSEGMTVVEDRSLRRRPFPGSKP